MTDERRSREIVRYTHQKRGHDDDVPFDPSVSQEEFDVILKRTVRRAAERSSATIALIRHMADRWPSERAIDDARRAGDRFVEMLRSPENASDLGAATRHFVRRLVAERADFRHALKFGFDLASNGGSIEGSCVDVMPASFGGKVKRTGDSGKLFKLMWMIPGDITKMWDLEIEHDDGTVEMVELKLNCHADMSSVTSFKSAVAPGLEWGYLLIHTSGYGFYRGDDETEKFILSAWRFKHRWVKERGRFVPANKSRIGWDSLVVENSVISKMKPIETIEVSRGELDQLADAFEEAFYAKNTSMELRDHLLKSSNEVVKFFAAIFERHHDKVSPWRQKEYQQHLDGYEPLLSGCKLTLSKSGEDCLQRISRGKLSAEDVINDGEINSHVEREVSIDEWLAS